MKRAKKLFSILLSTLLLLTCSAPAVAAGPVPVKKDETAYVILNQDGTVQKQIVSDWLHSDNGFHNVRDKSGLKEIENLKSNTQPVFRDGELIWNTEETDLYYRGETNAEPPVTAEIRYTLDGKELAPEELVGKSGHLTMAVKLTNQETETIKIGGKNRTVCTPFLTVCAALLPADSYQNVSAEHGAVQTDSKTQLACFLALPGVRDSISGLLPDDLQELEEALLDEFTIEADVTQCEMPTFLFAAAPGRKALLEELDIDQLKNTLNELTDATEQLQDGTVELDDAVGTLVEKLGEFADGYSQFDEGISTAVEGADQLAEGGRNLLDNAEILSEKSGELAAGAEQLRNGAVGLSDQLNTQLVPALTAAAGQKDALQNKMAGLSAQLNGLTIPDTSGLKTQLSAGVGQVFDGAAYGAAKAAATATGEVVSQQLSGALSGVQQAIPEKSAEIVDAVQGADLQVLQQVLSSGELGLTAEQQSAILAAAQSGMDSTKETLTAGVAQGITSTLPEGLLSGNPVSEEAAEQIASAVCGSEQMQAARAGAVSQVAAGVPELDTSSFQTLLGEFKTLSAEASSMLGQVDTLTAALYNASDPASQKTVVGAANALAEGAENLNAGTDALLGGTTAFASGVRQLSGGADSLSSGLDLLADSSKTVTDSISQFQSGGERLKEGTGKLKDGMEEFSEKAIDRLTNAVDPDSDLAKVLEAMSDRAERFEGTGCGEEMEHTVKYVMRTGAFQNVPKADGREGEQSSSSETTASAPAEETFWDRVKGLFN